ncbi:unnamed protein product [Closterium sp. Naga37s-1]|nr:unnamed protein product [Closterium sp. Naga37s-1]
MGTRRDKGWLSPGGAAASGPLRSSLPACASPWALLLPSLRPPISLPAVESPLSHRYPLPLLSTISPALPAPALTSSPIAPLSPSSPLPSTNPAASKPAASSPILPATPAAIGSTAFCPLPSSSFLLSLTPAAIKSTACCPWEAVVTWAPQRARERRATRRLTGVSSTNQHSQPPHPRPRHRLIRRRPQA